MYTLTQAHNIVLALSKTALHHLPSIDFDIPIRFESIGDGTFTDTHIACVARGHMLVVNYDWFCTTDIQDIKYIIWHEMRHFYQLQQIEALHAGKPTLETASVIQKWNHERTHYIPNTLLTSNAHFLQSIEVDAYAFAFAMLLKYCAKPDGSINIGLPPIIEEQIFTKGSDLYHKLAQMPVVRNKAMRNDPCPCGSGRKFKNCCSGLGVWE